VWRGESRSNRLCLDVFDECGLRPVRPVVRRAVQLNKEFVFGRILVVVHSKVVVGGELVEPDLGPIDEGLMDSAVPPVRMTMGNATRERSGWIASARAAKSNRSISVSSLFIRAAYGSVPTIPGQCNSTSVHSGNPGRHNQFKRGDGLALD